MKYTVEELIKNLQENYEPNETIVGTIYSQADIEEDWINETNSISELWDKVSDDFAGCINYIQETLNEELLELVEEATA